FYHVISCSAACEHAEVRLIIRDFDKDGFRAREDHLRKCAERLAETYGKDRVALTIHHQYSNMKEVLQQVPWLTETLCQAIRDSGLEPVCEPFRGGTDGAALTFRGLPCPNLSAGYENAHGRFEYVPIQSMVRNVEILRRLCAAFAARKPE
ncbi:MAG: peptidase T, partial [Firmicutes bacterium]|nr:peptidase T [Bacillota bacterium]